MACCIIAAYLAALAMEMVRRWAVFLGLARARPGEDLDTIYRRVARQFGAAARRNRSRVAR